MSQPLANFVPLADYSQWECGLQAFACDPTVGGGALFVKPPGNKDANREQWTIPDGQVAFMTGYETLLFQKPSPRVTIQPISYKPVATLVMDANGQLKYKAWDASVEFLLVTKNDYALHQKTLATLRATIQAMNPVGVDLVTGLPTIQTTGVNAFLALTGPFEMPQIFDGGGSLETKVSQDNAFMVTQYRCAAVFAIRGNAWPGGLMSA